MRFALLCASGLVGIAFVVGSGCSGSTHPSGFTNPDGATGPVDEAGVPIDQSDTGTFGPLDGSPPPSCKPDPANYDIPGNGCDDDGDGQIDNLTACDQGVAVNGPAGDFAKALGLCQSSGPAKWGVVSATYTNGHTSSGGAIDGQHGLLTKFGSVVKPREGKSFGVLSSGWAREFDGNNASSCTPGLFGSSGCFKDGVSMKGGQNDVPLGFPKPAPPCAVASDTHDIIDVKLQIKVPANAKGLQFDFDFWSGEWPEYVCTSFNDGFVAYLSSTGFNNGAPGNISFDAKGNAVSVNNGFFDRCTPGAQTGCMDVHTGTAACPGGTAELAGTGFEDPGTYCGGQSTGGGATGWLTTTAPVSPGETITLEYIIWDTGDDKFDSSVILDNFQWIPGPTVTGTGRPPK